MKANGLELKTINTFSTAYNEKEHGDYKKFLENNITDNSFFVVWLDFKVLIGRYDNEQFITYKGEKIEKKFIQKIRVFNKDKEFYMWRTQNGLRGRLREDNASAAKNKVEVVVANQVLFGTDFGNKCNGTHTEITEQRGTSLILPFPKPGLSVNDKKDRIFIKTHNYLDYNEVHQATYVDCRFVGFTNTNNDLQ